MKIMESNNNNFKIQNTAKDNLGKKDIFNLNFDDKEKDVIKEALSQHNKMWDFPESPEVFVVRQNKLDELKKCFNSETFGVITNIRKGTVTGTPGVGKSQLAVQFAGKAIQENQYDFAIWFNTEFGFESEYWRIFQRIIFCLNKNNYNYADVDPKEVTSEKLINFIYRIFYLIFSKVLLIFDNAADFNSLKRYLPPPELALKFHALITSRNQQWGTIKCINLRNFEENEAITLIAKVVFKEALLEKGSVEYLAASKLARTLRNFPLALAQAVAYIDHYKVDIDSYIEKFTYSQQELLNYKVEGDPYTRTLWSTLQMVVEELASTGQEDALNLLIVCSFLYPDAIPKKLLSAYLGENKNVNAVLGALSRFSLIHAKKDRKFIKIHRLVQSVIRSFVESKALANYASKFKNNQLMSRQFVKKLVGLIKATFIFDVSNAIQALEKSSLLQHAILIVNYAEYYKISNYSEIIFQLVDYYGTLEGYSSDNAGLFIEKYYNLLKQIGKATPEYARAINIKAVRMDKLGNYSGAIELAKEALKMYDPKNEPVKIAKIYNNIGLFSHHKNDYESAVENFKVALNCLNLEGKILENEIDHKVIKGRAMFNLAMVYIDKNMHPEAKENCEQAIVHYKKFKHSDLAFAYITYSRLLEKDIETHEAALEYLQKAYDFGLAEYKNTITGVIKSFTYPETSWTKLPSRDKDVKFYEKKLEFIRELYGEAHIESAKCLNQWGMACYNNSDYQNAIKYFKQALSICKKEIGDQHTNTEFVQANLSQVEKYINYRGCRNIFFKAVGIGGCVVAFTAASAALFFNPENTSNGPTI